MYRHLIIKCRPIEIGVSIWKSAQLGYMAEGEAGNDKKLRVGHISLGERS